MSLRWLHDQRHEPSGSLAEVFQIDPNTLAKRFLTHAPALATTAGLRALAPSGLEATDIDAVVVSTCTGYLCPGLSGYVVEGLGLRVDVQAFDLVGQGCAAALPTLHLHTPDPACDLDYVPQVVRAGVVVRTMLSNSFAFGGTNAVLVSRSASALAPHSG